MKKIIIKIVQGILFVPAVIYFLNNLVAGLRNIYDYTPQAIGMIIGAAVFALINYWLIYKMPSLVYRLFKKKDTQQVPSSSS